MKLAAVDIGSNAIRFQITKVLEHEDTISFKKLEYVRFPLRLGQDVFKNNEISAEKEAKFIKLIQTFKNLFELYEVDDYIVCATSAMRESKNGKDIVYKVKYLLGIDIEIIDGEKEAELINKVLFNELNGKTYLHVDVGGGSTELNFFENKKKIASRSFKIGSVRRLGGMDKPEEWHEMKKWIEKHSALVKKPITAVGTGGNIGKIYELANVKTRNKQQIISYKKIQEIQHIIQKHNYEDRVNKLMLNPDRADVIVPASEIYIAAMKYAKCSKMLVPEVGLKDGLMLMLYEKNKSIGNKNVITVNKYAK
ncbi:MAG: phosphatase [Cytophagaceae bacterium]|nr:phosphatase [Cytophagaceae bacterium]MDW8456776.1 phosphatase [Cytophagaceae bacterium]